VTDKGARLTETLGTECDVPGWRKAELVRPARSHPFRVTGVSHAADVSIEGLKIGPHHHDPKQFPWPKCEPGWEIRLRIANNSGVPGLLFVALTGESPAP